MEKVSYALGVSIASNLKGSGIDNLDRESFSKGLDDVLTGSGATMTPQELDDTLKAFFTEIQEKQAQKEIEAGKIFLEENKKNAGVVELPSGLQYQVLKEGYGEKPAETDQVKCHYHGQLIDGSVFDSSVERGEPAVFGVTQVIKGWVEALQLMTVGSKWRLFIPSELAYGAQGAGQAIKPHSTLIFNVELLEIVK